MEKDRYGIKLYADVARIDQYGEVAVKRYNPRVGWNRTEHLLCIGHYALQGKEILDAVSRHLKANNIPIDTFFLSKLCHKAAIAFTEAGNAETEYRKQYGRYGMEGKA